MGRVAKKLSFPSELFAEKTPFGQLSSSEIQELIAHGKELSFRAGEFLFQAGEPVTGIFFIFSGAVKISQTLRGKNRTVRFGGKGDWVGRRSIFIHPVYLGTARAREKTRAFFVPASLLLKFFGANPAFARQLVRQIAADLEATERKLVEYKDLNVSNRLISLFRGMERKFGVKVQEGSELGVRLSKVEISELIGASQEVVVRQISRWKKEALLREQGKHFWLSDKFLSRVTRGPN